MAAPPPSSPQDDLVADEQELLRWRDGLEATAARSTSAFEVRAELHRSRSLSWAKGALRGFSENMVPGLSLRVWVGAAVGFAGGHDPSADGLRGLVEDAVAMARRNGEHGHASFPYEPGPAERRVRRPEWREDPFAGDPENVLPLLRRAEEGAHAVDSAAYVRTMFAALTRRVAVANGGGRRTDVTTGLATLQAAAVHREGGALGDGIEWRCGERGLRDFEDRGGPRGGDVDSAPGGGAWAREGPEGLGGEAATRAVEASTAKAAPPGRQRVLCDNVLAGLLAHESFGHLTEYDLIASEWSVLHDRLGQRFAGDHVSVLDAPEVPGAPRDGLRLPVDDEGTEGRSVRILDGGVLGSYLHARGSAGEGGVAPTGNARALNARFAPIVRMRNTFFAPGDRTLAEALEALGTGVYLIGGRGGAPASDGSFMFTAVRGYRVEGGQLREPLRTTAISGNILDFLRNVEACTKDFRVEATNFGGCGKWGQSYIPLGMGGPHVLVADALVGGRA